MSDKNQRLKIQSFITLLVFIGGLIWMVEAYPEGSIMQYPLIAVTLISGLLFFVIRVRIFWRRVRNIHEKNKSQLEQRINAYYNDGNQ